MKEIVDTKQYKKINPYIIAFTVLLPAFLALAASSATNVCQPNIAGYFGATPYEANTVVTSYIISGGLMLPITGFLVKNFGKKKVMLYSIALFCIGAIFCLLAVNLPMLILARIVQGIGSGCILPVCQAVLLESFAIEKRGGAMGLFGIAAMFSPLAGPFMGGYLTDNLSWQWVFIINIPLCILSLLLVKILLPESEIVREKYNKRFDYAGYISVVVAMACLQIVLDKGEQFNWFDTPWICILTGICIFSFIFFIVWELEYKYPLVDIRIFKDRNYFFGTFVSSFLNIMLYSTLLLVPMFSQNLLGYSPSASGLAMFPRAIACFVGLIIVGEVSRYVENRVLTIIGLLIIGGSLISMTSLNTTASMQSIIIPNIILCFGVAVAFIPITSLSFLTLPASKNAEAAGMHALFKNIVTAMATALSATFISRASQVHSNYLVGNLSPNNPLFYHKLAMAQHKFSTYFAPFTAAKKAGGSLYKQMLLQAKLCSFYDAFQILALLAILVIPMVLILKTKAPKRKAA